MSEAVHEFAFENLDFQRPHAPRIAHRRIADDAGQRIYIVFGGRADQWWLRLLSPGFRHCFAAIADAEGWTILDPLSGRLLVQRLPLDAAFDLPAVYTRAGLSVLGPFTPMPGRARTIPPILPFTCVALCRALLGPDAPFALTPAVLFRRLQKGFGNRKINLTSSVGLA
ncbi:hypothetical protein [Plastoroseomonas arctica]|uniref:Uncharacterized protein n=1 Tax=Plastoroseomonas arctica TaxID=1509237 RepID=A0AAF1JWK5_9PROT|nr:hypothetical protein [Plastoroseomonas arctica]MBR0654797.1 hypothetical protein [Plastoroseomonas arctica]